MRFGWRSWPPTNTCLHLGAQVVDRSAEAVEILQGSHRSWGHIDSLWEQLSGSPAESHAWTDHLAGAKIRRGFTEQGAPDHIDKPAAFQKASAPGTLFPSHLLCYFAAQSERCFLYQHKFQLSHMSFDLLGYSQAQKLKLN